MERKCLGHLFHKAQQKMLNLSNVQSRSTHWSISQVGKSHLGLSPYVKPVTYQIVELCHWLVACNTQLKRLPSLEKEYD